MTLSSKQNTTYLAVEFRYGDPSAPTYSRYTNWGADITLSANTYTSLLALDADIPSDRGVIFEGAATVVIPVSDAFSVALASGSGHSPVFVTIYEVTLTVDAVSSLTATLFKGKVAQAIKNYRGRRNLLGLRCYGIKPRLDVSLGIPCNVNCAWSFTDSRCQVDPTGLAQTGSLYSADRFTAVIFGLTQPAFFVGGDVSRYWRRGYVEFDGLRILIQDWSETVPQSFELARPVPAAWVGETVTVFPGCDKEIATCRAQWDNEEHFGGMGFAMPAYKPTFENTA